MSNYPQGAIQTVEQLRALGSSVVFKASREHSNGVARARELSGTTGIKTYKDGIEYHYYEVIERHSNGDFDFAHITSLLDMNIPWNGYNDWFLFEKKEDAEAYLNAEPEPWRSSQKG